MPPRLSALLLCTALHALPAAAERPAWLERSDAYSLALFEALGAFRPEQVSSYGLERFDTEIMDLRPGHAQRFLATTQRELDRLRRAREAEGDARVRQDLEILIEALDLQRRTRDAERRLLLPYFNLPEQVFHGLRELLDERNGSERQRKALVRLQRYAGEDSAPIADLWRARMEEAMQDRGLLGPYAAELKQDRANCERYIGGIAELFRAQKLEGWEAAHGRLAAQLRAHCAWLEAKLAPRARAGPALPRELYALRLQGAGVDITPEQAIALGSFAFAEVRDDMRRLAPAIARARGLAPGDFRELLRALKRETVPAERIVALYRERLGAIEETIRRERIITLPERRAAIRLASEAESASIPAPYMNAPRLIGNRGEPGEFVLPLANPNARPGALADDFIAEGATWTLTAHEARPGHELQFAAMTERGVSLARAAFAFNSANAEGWALYAEAVMLPYFPLEGQFFSLQLRLLRAARAFLDPLVNLGRMSPLEAKEFLMREVAISEPFAQQEADRYAFRSPGQAVSYLYGYARLRELRVKAELALGARFDQRRLHDLIIEQGLLPLGQLERAVLEALGRPE